MRLPCTAQLHNSQLRCVYGIGRVLPCGPRVSRLVLHAKNNNQKNEGVYFEYEAVDPDAAEELMALEEEDEEQFSWAQRSRDRKKAYQSKVRNLTSDGTDRRQRKGGKRGTRATDALARERRKAAADAAAAAASDGPVLPSFSPVETPAMRARATTPEELLIRPKAVDADPRVIPSSPRPADSSGAAAAQRSGAQDGDTQDAQAAATQAAISGDGGTTADTAVPAQPGATGSSRRQKLLERMKGGGGGVAAAAGAAAAELGAAAAAEALQVQGGDSPAAGGAAASTVAAAKVDTPLEGSGTTGTTGRAEVDAATTEGEASSASSPPTLGGASAGTDFRSQLAAMAAQLPPESDLPPDARQARQLLASILDPTSDEVREVTGGDITEMLQRDLSAQEEFAQWLRSGGSRGASGGGGDGDGADELTEAEAADLMAALEGLGLEGDWADLGAGPEEDEMGGGEEDEGADGAAAVDAAVRQVSELRQLMAQLTGGDVEDDADDSGGGDMTDEQVLATLKASDPALYELLKDVPEFDKLDLDLDLDPENLSEAELAELAAEAEAAGGGAGVDEEAELEALLRDMRGLGLMRQSVTGASSGDGEGVGEEDEGGEDGEEEDDDAALGDLLEAIDEDEELDFFAKMRAQFALQSMFNQPADELTAKGTRGGAGEGAVEPSAPPPPRGTTGMARDASDDDGGAAPPPMLPRPRPRPR